MHFSFLSDYGDAVKTDRTELHSRGSSRESVTDGPPPNQSVCFQRLIGRPNPRWPHPPRAREGVMAIEAAVLPLVGNRSRQLKWMQVGANIRND